jgi:hypothetical protein
MAAKVRLRREPRGELNVGVADFRDLFGDVDGWRDRLMYLLNESVDVVNKCALRVGDYCRFGQQMYNSCVAHPVAKTHLEDSQQY